MKTSVGILIAVALLGTAGCVSAPARVLARRYAETAANFPAGGTAPRFDENATLDDYLGVALLRNAGLQAAFHRWKGTLERIPQARALGDPELMYEHSVTRKDFLYEVSLSQTLPWPGKLSLRTRMAQAEAEAAMREFETRKTMVFGDVVKAFQEYAYLRREIAVMEENVRLLADMEKVLRTRYEAGLAQFSDLTKIRVEHDRLKNDLASRQDERPARSAQLAAVLNIPITEVLPWPRVTPTAGALLSEDSLSAMLRDLNPELKAAEAVLEREKIRIALARRNRLPDFTVGGGIMVMPGSDGQSDSSEGKITAGIMLPVWQGKYAAEIREATALAEAAARDRDALENKLRAELRMQVFRTRDAERRLQLFRDSLLPKAQQALEVARQDFAAGKNDFLALVDAHRTLLEFRLLHERAMADREIALAEIGCCVGRYGAALMEQATEKR